MYGMVACWHIRFGGNREWGHNQELPQVFWLPHINSETGKANRTDFKINKCINRIHPNKNPFTNFGEESVDVSTEWQGLPNFSAPLLSEEGKNYGLQILYAYSQGRLEQQKQKAMKNFGKSGHGRSQRVPKIENCAVIFAIAQPSCISGAYTAWQIYLWDIVVSFCAKFRTNQAIARRHLGFALEKV